MCKHVHYVYNKYIHKSILCDCGKCPACQQKKAAGRANRIRNNVADGQIALFVTLTYDNRFVPYILKADLQVGYNYILVKRYQDVRRVRVGSGNSYDQGYKLVDGGILDEYEDFYIHCQKDIDDLPLLRNDFVDGRVGVCRYRDVQNFYKRLRINLKRHYGYEDGFTTFTCSEYGPTTGRPHFHALVFIPSAKEALFRRCIIESWPYADKDRTAKYIEVARDCASYVSTYVNRDSLFSDIFKTSEFQPKHSYSKVFGMALPDFSLVEILNKVESRDMRYYSKTKVAGVEEVHSFPIPKYVINRYFPLFKGLSRLDVDTLSSVLLRPARLFHYANEIGYTSEDIKKIWIRLNNAYEKYHITTGKNRFDFAIDYDRVWRCRRSVVLMDDLQAVSVVSDWYSYYDNAIDLFVTDDHFSSLVHSNLLDVNVCPDMDKYEFVPANTFLRRTESRRLEDLYYQKLKQRKVTNLVMSTGLNINV